MKTLPNTIFADVTELKSKSDDVTPLLMNDSDAEDSEKLALLSRCAQKAPAAVGDVTSDDDVMEKDTSCV